MVIMSFRTDDQTKTRVAKLFQGLGLDMSSAVNLFLCQPIANNGIPFTSYRDSAASALARTGAETRTGVYFDSVADLMTDPSVTG